MTTTHESAFPSGLDSSVAIASQGDASCVCGVQMVVSLV